MDEPTRAMWREAMELRIAQPIGGDSTSNPGTWIGGGMTGVCSYETVKAELERRKAAAAEAQARLKAERQIDNAKRTEWAAKVKADQDARTRGRA
jgi:hypothetical protein